MTEEVAIGSWLAGVPAGPELGAALASLDMTAVSNESVVDLLQACARQRAHAEGLYAAAVVAVVERAPVARYAADEVRAALALSKGRATFECDYALFLCRELPAVHEAMVAGLIDRDRALVFTYHLAGLPDDLVTAVVSRILPVAPELTTGQLRVRILKLIVTADPDRAEDQYAQALTERMVVGYLDSAGTATISATGLPPDEAAAATERIAQLARAAKRAGHRGRIDQLRADIFLRLLDGRFHHLTRAEMIAALLADTSAEVVAQVPGIEVRARLDTLAELNNLPGELPGWGPTPASVARRAAARQHGGEWRWAVTGADGHLLAEGITRHRPATTPPDHHADGGIVELAIPATALARLTKDPPPAWAKVITDIAAQYQHTLDDDQTVKLDAQPRRRHPTRAQRRHTQIRDRTCTAPGCRRSAVQSEQDHTHDNQHGGPTTSTNLGPACAHDHALKHQGGWKVAQPQPGHFDWTSPLGRIYRTRGEPITEPDEPPF